MSGEQHLPIIHQWALGLDTEEQDMIDIQQIEASINPQNYAQIGITGRAVMVTADNSIEVAKWVYGQLTTGDAVKFTDGYGKWTIARPGDYILRDDESGEFYRYNRKVFFDKFAREDEVFESEIHISLEDAERLARLMHKHAPLSAYDGKTWDEMDKNHREGQVKAAGKILAELLDPRF